MKYYIFSLSIILLSNFIKSENYDSIISDFDQYIEQSISKANIAGMGISILAKDSVIFNKGYGLSDIKNKKPFTSNTVMNIASISKTFIGVAIMNLVERKKVRLDDDINQFLPFHVYNPHRPDSIITLRHLMSHASGIIDEYKIYSTYYNYGDDSPVKLETFLKDYLTEDGALYSQSNFIKNSPGIEFHYSNIGAGLAGYIVERVSGKPFNIFTKEIIFEPLKMDNTCWFLSEMDRTKHSKIYKSQFFNLIQKEIKLYGLCTYPDGGLRTSINDLTKYLIYIGNRGANKTINILEDESFSEMFKIDYFNNYTKFWTIKESNTIGHGGNDPGVQTGMYYNLETNIGVIYFINTSPHGEFKNILNNLVEFSIKLNKTIKSPDQ